MHLLACFDVFCLFCCNPTRQTHYTLCSDIPFVIILAICLFPTGDAGSTLLKRLKEDKISAGIHIDVPWAQ
jgi:hypothetical protein